MQNHMGTLLYELKMFHLQQKKDHLSQHYLILKLPKANRQKAKGKRSKTGGKYQTRWSEFPVSAATLHTHAQWILYKIVRLVTSPRILDVTLWTLRKKSKCYLLLQRLTSSKVFCHPTVDFCAPNDKIQQFHQHLHTALLLFFTACTSDALLKPWQWSEILDLV